MIDSLFLLLIVFDEDQIAVAHQPEVRKENKHVFYSLDRARPL